VGRFPPRDSLRSAGNSPRPPKTPFIWGVSGVSGPQAGARADPSRTSPVGTRQRGGQNTPDLGGSADRRSLPHPLQQPVVHVIEMVLGQGEMPVVFGELGLHSRDLAGEPLPVAERNETVLAAV